MNNYPPSLTSGESASDINLPDAPPAKREKIKGSPVERWLEQRPIEDPWSKFTSRRRQALEFSEAIVKSADSYKVEDSPKSYIGKPIPFAGSLPSFPYVSSIAKAQDGAVTDTSNIGAVNGLAELPGLGISSEGSMPLKSTERAKMKYTPSLSFAW